ncbi:MAG TPA: hypothetical protein VGO41_08730 [Steroidobacteraceae bacterium]|jgi:hypothetical protein|nr:hypothetical protein [Steroidobacteraceae bacterium]
MRKVLKPMLLLAAIALCACSGDPPPKEEQVIAAPAIQAMEKAKTVEATVQQQKADIDKAVEAQGQ